MIGEPLMAFKIITTALTVEQTTSLDQTTNYLMKNILSDIHLPCYMPEKRASYGAMRCIG